VRVEKKSPLYSKIKSHREPALFASPKMLIIKMLFVKVYRFTLRRNNRSPTWQQLQTPLFGWSCQLPPQRQASMLHPVLLSRQIE
jgi:hypothetical protein